MPCYGAVCDETCRMYEKHKLSMFICVGCGRPLPRVKMIDDTYCPFCGADNHELIPEKFWKGSKKGGN